MTFESPSPTEKAPAGRLEVEPKLVEKIENEENFDNVDKEFLILVLAGEKPVAGLTLHQKSGENSEDFTRRVQKVRGLLAETGLPYEEEKTDIQGEAESGKNDQYSVYDFYISRDPQIAKEAMALASKKNDDRHTPESQERFGLLMGYPKTAVEAYIKNINDPRSQEPELPEDVEFAEYMDFKNFVVSQDHWREELETVKRWAETIREIAPDLYKKITSMRDRIDSLREEHPEEFKRSLLTDEKALRQLKFRDPALYEELVQERNRLTRTG